MITDQDADKIASMVFDRLVERWDARSAEVKQRKEAKETERLIKKEARARNSKVRQHMVRALEQATKEAGGPVFQCEWRARFAAVHMATAGALRVAFSRHRQALIDCGDVACENERYFVCYKGASKNVSNVTNASFQ